MGVGIHGEPGHSRQRLLGADAIIRHLCETISADISIQPDTKALLFVNGLGGTPPAELYLAYNAAHRFMEERSIHIERALVGTYVTSLDMQGLSVTLALLTDDEIALWDLPVATAALHRSPRRGMPPSHVPRRAIFGALFKEGIRREPEGAVLNTSARSLNTSRCWKALVWSCAESARNARPTGPPLLAEFHNWTLTPRRVCACSGAPTRRSDPYRVRPDLPRFASALRECARGQD